MLRLSETPGRGTEDQSEHLAAIVYMGRTNLLQKDPFYDDTIMAYCASTLGSSHLSVYIDLVPRTGLGAPICMLECLGDYR